ncbi:MAG: NAD-dependent epimerase/dehydratase family protein [Vicinamibacterales bacterium]
MLTHGERRPLARVVVLGGSGFVGRSLLSHLDTKGIATLALTSRDLDLTGAAAGRLLAPHLRPGDALVFAAALTPDKGKDIATLMKNLAMGEQVSAALAAAPCAHVVYISSDAVYADDADPVNEASCTNPSSYHGLMHLVRERMLAMTLGSGTPLAIVRPSLLYGSGDTHNGYGPNRFLRTARADRTIALVGRGEERRDHVFIDDLSRLIALVLTNRSAGALNVATGTSRSFGDVAERVAALVPGTRVESMPRSGAVTHRSFDVAAVDAAFPGFRFATLEEGLARA